MKLLLLTFASVQAQKNTNWSFNYAQQGVDWPNLISSNGELNNCGSNGQSPVNLLQPIGSYGWAYGNSIPKADDNSAKAFSDMGKKMVIDWNDHSVQFIQHPSDMIKNSFVSDIGKAQYSMTANKFENVEFKVKSSSEHTINGYHHDVELQLYFRGSLGEDVPVEKRQQHEQAAAIAILFSVESSSKNKDENPSTTIDNMEEAKRAANDFFDSLQYGKMDQTVIINEEGSAAGQTQKIELGRLMNAVDLEDRWIYKGSYTEPPCNPGVYWNVVRTVYPIDNNTFEQIKQKMAKLSAENDPAYTYDEANFAGAVEDVRTRTDPVKFYRKLQKVNTQNIQYLSAVVFGKMTAAITAATSGLAIWLSY